MTRNNDIRAAAKSAGVGLWQVAEALHCHESTLYRRLRRNLSEDERAEMLELIQTLASS